MRYFRRVMVTLALLTASLQMASASEPLTKVRAGHLVALDMAPLFVAKESGCFADNGLEVESYFFANPGDNNAALAGGSIDFSHNPFSLAFFAANNNVPVRVIGASGGWGVMEVIAQEVLDFNSIDDLKSHISLENQKLKIATLQGDTLELILVRAFAAHDISLEDVDLVYFNDLLAMVEAFRSGSVDMLSHIKPYTTQMVRDRNATVVTRNSDVWSATTPSANVISVLERTLAGRPRIVEAYLSGLLCAAAIINDTPEKAVDLLTKGNYYRVAPEVLLSSFTSSPAPVSFTPDLDAAAGMLGDMRDLGYIRDGATAADIFRLDIINRLER